MVFVKQVLRRRLPRTSRKFRHANRRAFSGEITLGGSSGGSNFKAGYTANVAIDNTTTLFDSRAQVENDGITTQLTINSGTNLGTYVQGEDTYKWDIYNGTVNFQLNPGVSRTLVYSLSTYVDEFLTDGYSYTPKAELSDPFVFGATPLFANERFVTSAVGPVGEVPEPASVALIGIGLAGLAFRKKTRKSNA